MSLLKNDQKCSPTHFWSILIHNFTVVKSSLKIWATSIFKKTSQSKKSPNGRKIAPYGHPDAAPALITRLGTLGKASSRCLQN
jgi:hypothetical protein